MPFVKWLLWLYSCPLTGSLGDEPRPALSSDASDSCQAGKYVRAPNLSLCANAGFGHVLSVLPIDVYLFKKTYYLSQYLHNIFMWKLRLYKLHFCIQGFCGRKRKTSNLNSRIYSKLLLGLCGKLNFCVCQTKLDETIFKIQIWSLIKWRKI